MNRVILAALTVLMLACTKNTNQPQMANTKFADNYISPVASKVNAAHHNQSNGKHILLDFKQSNCKTATSTTEKILHKALQSDTLVIKVRSPQNCDTQYKGDFNFADNHLILTVTQLPKIIKRKSGQIDTIYTTQLCNCMYEFTYTINRIRALPQTITLNGKIIN